MCYQPEKAKGNKRLLLYPQNFPETWDQLLKCWERADLIRKSDCAFISIINVWPCPNPLLFLPPLPKERRKAEDEDLPADPCWDHRKLSHPISIFFLKIQILRDQDQKPKPRLSECLAWMCQVCLETCQETLYKTSSDFLYINFLSNPDELLCRDGFGCICIYSGKGASLNSEAHCSVNLDRQILRATDQAGKWCKNVNWKYR